MLDTRYWYACPPKRSVGGDTRCRREAEFPKNIELDKPNIENRESNIENREPSIENRASGIEHRAPNLK
jgi:hypothetical protein